MAADPDRALVGAVAATVALQILLVAIPFTRDIMGLEPLAGEHWLLAAGIAFAYLVVVELDKSIHRRRRASRGA